MCVIRMNPTVLLFFRNKVYKFMHTFLSQVSRPARYSGQEYNSIVKPWDSAQARFALVFPDLYEIGMSHQGLQILYHILNKTENFLAERCFCPDTDAEQILKESDTSLSSLESARPLSDFDIIGITLPYELCYTNILTILDLAKIPFYAKDRNENHPILLAGGACSLNPEPVAEFFDVIFLGDGEEGILEIGALIAEAKSNRLSRLQAIEKMAEISGVYIPSHFEMVEEGEGIFPHVRSISNKSRTVTRRVVKNLDQIDHLKHPIVPNARIVHDRLGIEIARGCTRGCRFCQAGITYRPVRERSNEAILELAESGLGNTGFEELALLSLSTGDYSCLDQTLPTLMDRFSGDFVSVAMPSMRVGTLTPAIMEQVKRVRKTGFTLAPEAGSDRLRNVINKGISEENLLDTCRQAFELGWQKIKLYFMIGLPTETEEDIDAIVDLVNKILKLEQGAQGRNKRQITVSVGTFVPKPHTPFQWHKQFSIGKSQATIQKLKNSLPRKRCSLRYHSPKLSYLEGVFSRGDRRLAQLIVEAWQQGAHLDGWDEHFDLVRWQEAAARCSINLDQYLENRPQNSPLPWSHLKTGVDESFLQSELQKSLTGGEYTPDCRYHGCQKCGLCDFKTLAPVVRNKKRFASDKSPQTTAVTPPGKIKRPDPSIRFSYMVQYSRRGRSAYLGHLEILQLIFRTLKRAQIPLHFSQGFNPSPKVSFGPALPVGTESEAEFFLMELHRPLGNTEAILNTLNDVAIPGITFTSLALQHEKMPQRLKTKYAITLPAPVTQEQKEHITKYNQCKSYTVTRERKGKRKTIEIKPIVAGLSLLDKNLLELDLVTEAGMPAIKPAEAIEKILELSPKDILKLRILKKEWSKMK